MLVSMGSMAYAAMNQPNKEHFFTDQDVRNKQQEIRKLNKEVNEQNSQEKRKNLVAKHQRPFMIKYDEAGADVFIKSEGYWQYVRHIGPIVSIEITGQAKL